MVLRRALRLVLVDPWHGAGEVVPGWSRGPGGEKGSGGMVETLVLNIAFPRDRFRMFFGIETGEGADCGRKCHIVVAPRMGGYFCPKRWAVFRSLPCRVVHISVQAVRSCFPVFPCNLLGVHSTCKRLHSLAAMPGSVKAFSILADPRL